MTTFFRILLLLIPSASLANESILGSYNSHSEAECNLVIILKAQGHGIASQTCTREDGSHLVDEESYEFKWDKIKQGILLTHNEVSMLFHYSENLSCSSLGKIGSIAGIYTNNENKDSIFSGYGGKFWSSTGECK